MEALLACRVDRAGMKQSFTAVDGDGPEDSRLRILTGKCDAQHSTWRQIRTVSAHDHLFSGCKVMQCVRLRPRCFDGTLERSGIAIEHYFPPRSSPRVGFVCHLSQSVHVFVAGNQESPNTPSSIRSQNPFTPRRTPPMASGLLLPPAALLVGLGPIVCAILLCSSCATAFSIAATLGKMEAG